MYKFRETPNSLFEMYAWGMISHNTYEQFEKSNFEWAKGRIENTIGYCTWSFGIYHLREYIKTQNVDVLSFSKNDWVAHCIKLARGRISQPAVVQIYDEHFRESKYKIGQYVLMPTRQSKLLDGDIWVIESFDEINLHRGYNVANIKSLQTGEEKQLDVNVAYAVFDDVKDAMDVNKAYSDLLEMKRQHKKLEADKLDQIKQMFNNRNIK